jgi:hypothetical protein
LLWTFAAAGHTVWSFAGARIERGAAEAMIAEVRAEAGVLTDDDFAGARPSGV